MTRPSAINAPERETQNRVLDLFATLGYRSLGSLHGQDNRNIRTADLTAWLQKQGVADGLIAKTLHKLEQAAAVGGVRKLYDANKDVYQLLRYGVKVAPAAGEQTQTVWLVDWGTIHQRLHRGRVCQLSGARHRGTDKRPSDGRQKRFGCGLGGGENHLRTRTRAQRRGGLCGVFLRHEWRKQFAGKAGVKAAFLSGGGKIHGLLYGIGDGFGAGGI